MSLISETVKKAIEKEAKNQKAFLKILENQEKNYSKDYTAWCTKPLHISFSDLCFSI